MAYARDGWMGCDVALCDVGIECQLVVIWSMCCAVVDRIVVVCDCACVASEIGYQLIFVTVGVQLDSDG